MDVFIGEASIEISDTLQQKLTNLCFSLTMHHHGSWSAGSGGDGTVTLNVVEGTYEVCHDRHHIESTHTEKGGKVLEVLSDDDL